MGNRRSRNDGPVTVRVVTFRLTIPDARSLKEKRMVLRSLKDRMRTRFNVSVAETGLQDTWDRAQLSVAFLTPDGASADRTAEHLDRFLDESGRAIITDVTTETFRQP